MGQSPGPKGPAAGAVRGLPFLPRQFRESAGLFQQILFAIGAGTLFVSIAAGLLYNVERWQRPPSIAIDHRELGKDWISREDYARAAAEFRGVQAIAPSDQQSIARLAMSLRAQGRSDEALAVLEEARDHWPQSVIAQHQLAMALYDEGRTGEAIESFQAAIRLRPERRSTYATSFLRRGNEHIDAGEPEAAGQTFAVVLAIDPASADGHNGMGVAYAMKQEFDPAIEHLNEALRLDPDLPGARQNLSRAIQAQRRSRNQGPDAAEGSR